MPRESFDIKLFNKGIISSVDAEDIPVDSASYSENIDGDAVEGRLQGIPASTTKFSDKGLYVGKSAWIRRDTGEYDLIYDDRNGANIKAISNFYTAGSETESTPISSFNAKSIVVQNKAVHIGTGSTASYPPKFIGRASYNLFGGVGKVTFTGAGTNDMTAGGTYTGTTQSTFDIKIYSSGAPDYIQIRIDGGSWSSAIPMASSWTTTGYTIAPFGLKIGFTGISGHTVGDIWSVSVYPQNELISADAEIKNYPDNTAGTTNGYFQLVTNYPTPTSGGVITHGKLRRYKFSLIYDGVQESLLNTDNPAGLDMYDASNDYQYVNINIKAIGGAGYLTTFNQRITAINVYVATSPDEYDTNLGLYRLVKSIQIANNHGVFLSSPTDLVPSFTFILGALNGDNLNCNIHDTDELGATYEANTGIPQNTDTLIVNYELNASVNGYLFAGKCYSQYLPDAKLTIFRSKELRYDMFDIVNDKMQLNILPTAMAGFNGKLYVWDLNTTIIINPQGLYIENIIHGKGCASQTSWAVIDIQGEHILTFCDANNVYATDGAGISDIGEPIKKSASGVSWQGLSHSTVDPIVIFDATRNTVFYISKYGNYSVAYGYHIVRKRWDYYPSFVGAYVCQGAFAGKNGETYSSNTVALLTNFNGTSNRGLVWESQSLTFNSPSQYKEFTYMYQDKVETSGALTALYSADGGSYTALTNTTQIKDGTGKFVRAKIFKFKIYTTSTGVHYLNSLSILVRRMIGAR